MTDAKSTNKHGYLADTIAIAAVIMSMITARPFIMIGALVFCAVLIGWRVVTRMLDNDPLSYDDTCGGTHRGAVDPWEYQRKLMEISSQRTPRRPRLTNGSVLYAALIMEEAAETYAAMAEALKAPYREGDSPYLWLMADLFRDVAAAGKSGSLQLRDLLGLVGDFDLMISDPHAQELLDGTTDIMVVNCGFSIATGLPGAAAYDEVGSSNLSKANPATGKIDKDPSGKWIKGSQFFKPDLARVLAENAH